MPVSVLGLGLVLLMGGLGTFVFGLSLTPTDMGRSWLVVGATLLSGAFVVLAVGFGTQALLGALEPRGAEDAAQPSRVAAPPSGPEPLSPEAVAPPVPSLAPLPAPELPAVPDMASAPEAPLPPPIPEPPRQGLRLPGMAALGGVALGAGGALFGGGTKAEAAQMPVQERVPPEPPAFEPMPAAPPPLPKDALEEELFQDMSDLHADREIAEEPAPDAALLPEPPPLPELVLRPGLAVEPPPLPVAAESLPAETLPAEPVSVPGLIADDDLEALASEEPLLLPLETLEVVGAYDSGGVRFTMYSDGSVNAVGSHGERRYRSLEALRRKLDSGEPAV